jgi:hypothetical protein
MYVIDEKLIHELTAAQLKHAHNMTEDESIDHAMWSDDGYDYLKAALKLGAELLEIQYNADIQRLKNMLNEEHEEFIPQNYACDGVCAEIWALIPENWAELIPDRNQGGNEANDS